MRHSCLFRRARYLAGLIALLLGLAGRAAAQTTPADTTRLRYQEEPLTAPAPAVLLPVQLEERGAWKLGLNNFVPSGLLYDYYARYGVHLAYEGQVGRPAWSILSELSPAITRSRWNSAQELTTGLAVRAQVAGRYYYNRERRLRRGHRVGGFSANYFSLVIGASFFGSSRQRETAFFPLQVSSSSSTAPAADVALLYGLQRRVGRYGFVDASVGLGNLFELGLQSYSGFKGLVANLRLGWVLGKPPYYPARAVPADDDTSLHPRVYLGVQAGRVGYRVQYSAQYPYPADAKEVVGAETRETRYRSWLLRGYGAYAVYETPVPGFYVGYYLTPRLAVQAGAQYWATSRADSTIFSSAQGRAAVPNLRSRTTGLVLPVLVRYSLTASFLRHWQFEALGGLTPVRSTAEFAAYALDQRQVTSQQTAGFRRAAWGLHATAGLTAGYGFGRLRRVQATAEVMAAKDLRTPMRVERVDDLPLSASLGLRYRFGYQ